MTGDEHDRFEDLRAVARDRRRDGAVVRSVEPDFALVDCLTADNACRLTGNCRLTGIVSEALQSFMAHLDRHTLADLLPAPGDGAARLRPVTFAKRPAPVPT